MAKVIAMIVDSAQTPPYVGALLEDGTQVPIVEGFEFFTAADVDARLEKEREALLVGIKDEIAAKSDLIESLQAEIGALQRVMSSVDIAQPKPVTIDHQNVPVPRTLDQLGSLDDLKPHPTLEDLAGQSAVAVGAMTEFKADTITGGVTQEPAPPAPDNETTGKS